VDEDGTGAVVIIDEVKVTVVKGNLTAHRPLTEGPTYGHPFIKHAVSDVQEESPFGVGIRLNRDDDDGNFTEDRWDSGKSEENDLIEVAIDIDPVPGIVYKLRVPMYYNIWETYLKTGEIIGSGDCTVTLSSGIKEVWVECCLPSSGDLELLANDVVIDKIHFYPFKSIVALFCGENGNPTDPTTPAPSTSFFADIAVRLYDEGYDVHMYEEPDIHDSPLIDHFAFWEIKRGFDQRGVDNVALLGYSHGGGTVYIVSKDFDDDSTSFNLGFAAYVDAIEQPLLNSSSETRMPIGCSYLVNFYQTSGMIHGGPVLGASQEIDVTNPPTSHNHFTIPCDPEIHNYIIHHLTGVVPK
jgi:hypothetical protein